MNCSTPGLPVHHQLPEFTQTHVYGVSDAIQPSHLLSSLSLPAPNPSQHQGLFQWVNSLQRVAKRWPKYWSFMFSISLSNEHPRLISFRMDWLDLLAVILQSPAFDSILSLQHLLGHNIHSYGFSYYLFFNSETFISSPDISLVLQVLISNHRLNISTKRGPCQQMQTRLAFPYNKFSAFLSLFLIGVEGITITSRQKCGHHAGLLSHPSPLTLLPL